VSAVIRCSSVVLLLFASLVAGCDMASQIADSMTHAGPIEAEIEKAVGMKPNVFGATTASLLVVTVTFSEVPSLPVSELEAIARAAVVHEYKKEPAALTISFVFQKFEPRP
jgi:hypothetical protein